MPSPEELKHIDEAHEAEFNKRLQVLVKAARAVADSFSYPGAGKDAMALKAALDQFEPWLEDTQVDEQFSITELAAILCGLRCLQQVRSSCGGDLPDDLADILVNEAGDDEITDEEINALCERLNQ